MRSQSNSTPWAALFFALLGLAWCGYVAFPTATPAPCATSGCALFRDSTIAGISLWWIGGAYFFLLAILCLRGSRHLARLISMLALFADAVLLVIMFLTAPCFDCLVVAAIIGLCYLTIKPAQDGWFAGVETKPSVLLPIWFGLFLGNAALAANEQFPLYAVGNTRNADVRVYFSPSCKACREAISSLGNAAALYPVLENETDLDAVITFTALLKANVPAGEAILRSIDAAEPRAALPFHERMMLKMRLMRNKAALLRQGFRALPLVQVNGWPGEKPSSLEAGPHFDGQAAPSRSAAGPEGDASPAGIPGEEGIARSGADQDGHGGSDGPGFEPPYARESAPLPDFLADPDALEQCGGDNPQPCD